MSVVNSLLKFFQEGGLFMYPILFLFAAGVAIAVERWLFLTRERIVSRSEWERLMPHLYQGDFLMALEQARKSRAALANILVLGLNRVQKKKSPESVEKVMLQGLMEFVPRLEKRTHYLATLANLATLLGLLGTIVGLIQAFTAVANADPAQKADLLSASISVAMNTTAFGLLAAIPLLLIHSLLMSKTTEIVNSLEMAAMKLVNLLDEKEEAPDGEQHP
ncbi:MAG TPA: MotA/TolQ/ExbB proton channel family protein [Gammaproteobacteria bacterium]